MKKLIALVVLMVGMFLVQPTEANGQIRVQIGKGQDRERIYRDGRVQRDESYRDRVYREQMENERRGVYQNRNKQVRYETRTVRYGRVYYRETYKVVYKRNGRVTSKLVSRVRVY